MVVTAVRPDVSHDARDVHPCKKLLQMVVTAVRPDVSHDARDVHPRKKLLSMVVTAVSPDVSNATMLLRLERNPKGMVLPSSTHIEMRNGSLIKATALKM